jgi:hypothetical protein
MKVLLGKEEESLSDYENLLEARTRILGRKHVATTGAILGIAQILQRQGWHLEAFKLLSEALAIRESLVGPYNVLTRNILPHLENSYCHVDWENRLPIDSSETIMN